MRLHFSRCKVRYSIANIVNIVLHQPHHTHSQTYMHMVILDDNTAKDAVDYIIIHMTHLSCNSIEKQAKYDCNIHPNVNLIVTAEHTHTHSGHPGQPDCCCLHKHLCDPLFVQFHQGMSKIWPKPKHVSLVYLVHFVEQVDFDRLCWTLALWHILVYFGTGRLW